MYCTVYLTLTHHLSLQSERGYALCFAFAIFAIFPTLLVGTVRILVYCKLDQINRFAVTWNSLVSYLMYAKIFWWKKSFKTKFKNWNSFPKVFHSGEKIQVLPLSPTSPGRDEFYQSRERWVLPVRGEMSFTSPGRDEFYQSRERWVLPVQGEMSSTSPERDEFYQSRERWVLPVRGEMSSISPGRDEYYQSMERLVLPVQGEMSTISPGRDEF